MVTEKLTSYMEAIKTAPVEWVAENIHPYVVRTNKDTNASYLRKMALYAQATNLFPRPTNKPINEESLDMNDTPETDAAWNATSTDDTEFANAGWEFARRLERERNEARARYETLREENRKIAATLNRITEEKSDSIVT